MQERTAVCPNHNQVPTFARTEGAPCQRARPTPTTNAAIYLTAPGVPPHHRAGVQPTTRPAYQPHHHAGVSTTTRPALPITQCTVVSPVLHDSGRASRLAHARSSTRRAGERTGACTKLYPRCSPNFPALFTPQPVARLAGAYLMRPAGLSPQPSH